uniref:C2H2-type domain-containing protein n=1 Tax=Romanomermis culicivorax TaxID=13658 RepID=A0A915HLR1_ROMCU
MEFKAVLPVTNIPVTNMRETSSLRVQWKRHDGSEYVSHQWSLSHHIKRSKSQSGVKDHECQLCSFTCDNLADFAVHLDTSGHKMKVEREIFIASRKFSPPEQPPPNSRRSNPLLSNVIFPPSISDMSWMTRPRHNANYPCILPPSSRKRHFPLNYQQFPSQPFSVRQRSNSFLTDTEAARSLHQYAHSNPGFPPYKWIPPSASQGQPNTSGQFNCNLIAPNSTFKSGSMALGKKKKKNFGKKRVTNPMRGLISQTTPLFNVKNVRIAEPDSTTGVNLNAAPENGSGREREKGNASKDVAPKKPSGNAKKKSKVDKFSSSAMKSRQKMIEESISRRLLTQRLKKYQVETPGAATTVVNKVTNDQKTQENKDNVAYRTVVETNGTVNIVPNRKTSSQLNYVKEINNTEQNRQCFLSTDVSSSGKDASSIENAEKFEENINEIKAEDESFHALDFMTENCETLSQAAITTDTQGSNTPTINERCTIPSATCQISIVKNEIILSDEEENACTSSSLAYHLQPAELLSPAKKVDEPTVNSNQEDYQHSQKLEKLWSFCKEEEKLRADIRSMGEEMLNLKRRLEELKRRRSERQKELDLCQIEKNKLLAEGRSSVLTANSNPTEAVSAAHLQYLGIINSQNPIFQSIEMALGLTKNSDFLPK